MPDDRLKQQRPVGEAIRGALVGVGLMAALLLVPAWLVTGGRWVWPRGLALIAAQGAVSLAGGLALAIWRPAHFRVRQQGVVAERGKGQPAIDAVGGAAYLVLAAAWVVFIAIDVFRLHWLPAPAPWVMWLGGAAVIVGAALTPLAVWENRFATPNVQDQTGAGQRIVATGVYGLIRHPIYLGNLLLPAGAALWLGSYAALMLCGVFVLGTAWRIAIEERHLRAQFPEYAAYAGKVRARLIPFVI
jgi:protein-S-isoprenylcysteine O-methyltransferase Ste14